MIYIAYLQGLLQNEITLAKAPDYSKVQQAFCSREYTWKNDHYHVQPSTLTTVCQSRNRVSHF